MVCVMSKVIKMKYVSLLYDGRGQNDPFGPRKKDCDVPNVSIKSLGT